MSTTISILGGVGLFLLGMTVMTTGLKTLAGSALRTVLARAAATPLSGTFWGAVATLVVQSSSATTMTTIGLVSAGLLTFSQGLGLVFGANVGTTLLDGTSPLVVAVINAHYELAGLLLEKGADPNADAQGWTALHQVAWSRRHNAGFNLPGPVPTGNLDSLDLVRKLVSHGANLNARVKKEPRDGNRNMLNRIGSTPFLMAAKSDDVPLMRVLLELGADPKLTTDEGTTALMVAAGVGIWAPGENPGTHEEALAAVKLALEAGGGAVNDVNQNGETALHGAVYRGGAIPVIQFLADNGARLDVVNKKGWTPLRITEGIPVGMNIAGDAPTRAILRELLGLK